MMKKIIFFIFLFLGIYPVIENGVPKLSIGATANAQGMGGELGEVIVIGYPDDPPPPPPEWPVDPDPDPNPNEDPDLYECPECEEDPPVNSGTEENSTPDTKGPEPGKKYAKMELFNLLKSLGYTVVIDGDFMRAYKGTEEIYQFKSEYGFMWGMVYSGDNGENNSFTIPSDGMFVDKDGNLYYDGMPWSDYLEWLKFTTNNDTWTNLNDILDEYEVPQGYDDWADFWVDYYENNSSGNPNENNGCPILKAKTSASFVLAGTTDPNWCIESRLNVAELAIVQTIINEDVIADAIANSPSPCYGTNRNGNVRWQGTAEHWLIQYDYVSNNSGGLREYSIPGSSVNGNRGFADLVNTVTNEIFEIKPNNLTGQNAGALEVENYVNKANISCPPSNNGIWDKGVNYSIKYLPHPTDQTKLLKSELFSPGVIVYEAIDKSTNPQPAPIPVVLPENLALKLKNFAISLINNPQGMEVRTMLFLKQNPNMVPYLKAAAAGIVIGTIVEDILTGGGGIADDWACFVAARMIYRVASKIP